MVYMILKHNFGNIPESTLMRIQEKIMTKKPKSERNRPGSENLPSTPFAQSQVRGCALAEGR
jgi:hypothetical protein